ncbi:hypothetical protein BCR34DRAFT_130650 [Clohesyomyces aquaticus]|uniref:Uncharacterized protein n=1 Tax=Clohesyomyces aquaticus TaxID=1231657 RepID=A0A1Y2AB13_9PLEO|nr:hypothetical protein BCR34DRAFT_130650 [Clohesyomyces aquaticus]
MPTSIILKDPNFHVTPPPPWGDEEHCSDSPKALLGSFLVSNMQRNSKSALHNIKMPHIQGFRLHHMICLPLSAYYPQYISEHKDVRLKKDIQPYIAAYEGHPCVQVSIAHRINQIGLHLPLTCIPLLSSRSPVRHLVPRALAHHVAHRHNRVVRNVILAHVFHGVLCRLFLLRNRFIQAKTTSCLLRNDVQDLALSRLPFWFNSLCGKVRQQYISGVQLTENTRCDESNHSRLQRYEHSLYPLGHATHSSRIRHLSLWVSLLSARASDDKIIPD